MSKNDRKRILPSYPLFVKDPSYSIWMGADQLNDRDVETWFGARKELYGFVKTAEGTFCFLGNADAFASLGVQKAVQTSLKVTAFTTDYTFSCGAVTLRLRFVSPVPPDDLELLSLPVCYLEYAVEGGEAEVSLFVGRNFCYNDVPETADKRVRGGVIATDGFESAFMGLARQLPLSATGDLIGADWGYWYLAADEAYLCDISERNSYLTDGGKAFVAADEERYIAAFCRESAGTFLLGYDEGAAIDYFGDHRKGYYLETHTIIDALSYMRRNRTAVNDRLAAFDLELCTCAQKYGDDYVRIVYAALRQSMAAHKLVRDGQGNTLWLSKECGSCGCIATVDVSYPSAPLFMLYNAELVKGMLRPIFRFARMPVWTYDFAPHDAGAYPVCCGQTYGLKQNEDKYHGRIGEGGFWADFKTHYPYYLLPSSFAPYDLNRQMPVEESADMLVMLYGAYRADKDISMFVENGDLCKKWTSYLIDYGLRPENQLCTDDFAGHLENNVNLSIKATVGIACYAELLTAAGERDAARRYRAVAERFAAEISAFSAKYEHLPLTWDGDETTFSLKYNFAFDKVFGLRLFDQALWEKEVDCYLERLHTFGTPLDNRKNYTKSDWLVWVAALTDDAAKRGKILSAVNAFLEKSPDRVPFGDWYDSDDGKFREFRARSVQGGCFILLLK